MKISIEGIISILIVIASLYSFIKSIFDSTKKNKKPWEEQLEKEILEEQTNNTVNRREEIPFDEELKEEDAILDTKNDYSKQIDTKYTKDNHAYNNLNTISKGTYPISQKINPVNKKESVVFITKKLKAKKIDIEFSQKTLKKALLYSEIFNPKYF